MQERRTIFLDLRNDIPSLAKILLKRYERRLGTAKNGKLLQIPSENFSSRSRRSNLFFEEVYILVHNEENKLL